MGRLDSSASRSNGDNDDSRDLNRNLVTRRQEAVAVVARVLDEIAHYRASSRGTTAVRPIGRRHPLYRAIERMRSRFAPEFVVRTLGRHLVHKVIQSSRRVNVVPATFTDRLRDLEDWLKDFQKEVDSDKWVVASDLAAHYPSDVRRKQIELLTPTERAVLEVIVGCSHGSNESRVTDVRQKYPTTKGYRVEAVLQSCQFVRIEGGRFVIVRDDPYPPKQWRLLNELEQLTFRHVENTPSRACEIVARVQARWPGQKAEVNRALAVLEKGLLVEKTSGGYRRAHFADELP